MEFEYAVKGRDLLTVDAIRLLYLELPTGGFLAEDGLEVKTTDGAHVDVGVSIMDTLGMLAGGPVEHASLSHRPGYSFLLAGAGYWRVELTAADAQSVKVSINSDSHRQVKELKAIVDSYFLNRTNAPGSHGGPQTEPWPAPSAFPGDPDYKAG